MSAYAEKKDRNHLILSDNNANKVNITFNAYGGTRGKLTFISPNNSPVLSPGDTMEVDTVGVLKAKKRISFLCDADNPDGKKADCEFIITEEGGNIISYRFQRDFTGTPAVPVDEDSPFLTFYCTFE